MMRSPGRAVPHDAIRNLVGCLLLDDAPADGAVGRADACIEQAQVIIDFRRGADGRARVLGSGLLVDRDGGGEAVDRIDVGFLHLSEELTRVRGEGFDVATLTLGVDGVEGERAFARAGEAREDDELVTRNREVDILEVVLTCTFDDDVFGSHEPALGYSYANMCSHSV